MDIALAVGITTERHRTFAVLLWERPPGPTGRRWRPSVET